MKGYTAISTKVVLNKRKSVRNMQQYDSNNNITDNNNDNNNNSNNNDNDDDDNLFILIKTDQLKLRVQLV